MAQTSNIRIMSTVQRACTDAPISLGINGTTYVKSPEIHRNQFFIILLCCRFVSTNILATECTLRYRPTDVKESVSSRGIIVYAILTNTNTKNPMDSLNMVDVTGHIPDQSYSIKLKQQQRVGERGSVWGKG